MTVEEIIKLLDLKPHPEGGFYRETYKSSDIVPTEQLPGRYTLVTGPPTDKSFTRETMEWQVPPELEKAAQEAHATSISPRPGQTATPENSSKTSSATEEKRKDEKRNGEKPNDAAGKHGGADKSQDTRFWATCIYYLLTPGNFSAMHKLKGDEVYHFYLGDPVEMLNLYPNGKSEIIKLGHDIAGGALLQHVVQHGVWQGSRLIEGGKFALMGTTMSPGFSFKDCEFGSYKQLAHEWSSAAELIKQLTRE